MTIDVRGADWDTAMLRALEQEPPPRAGAQDRHLHVVRLLVEVIGDDLKVFLRWHGAKYTAHRPGPADPVVALVSWMAEYFLHLHDFMRDGPAAISGWPDAVRRAGALRPETRLVLTMQLGCTLLLPILLEHATGRPAHPVVHDRNTAVLAMYGRRLHGRPLVLTRLTAAGLREALDSGGILVANIDTCYPGTRNVRSLPFLDGRLTVPAGLLSLACRRSLGVQAMAAPVVDGSVRVRIGPRLPGGVDDALREFGRFFERWVMAHPEQWMAWASLEADAGGASALR